MTGKKSFSETGIWWYKEGNRIKSMIGCGIGEKGTDKEEQIESEKKWAAKRKYSR